MERKALRRIETISATQLLRLALLTSTAFSPFALSVSARAQTTMPAPDATPQGGVVSAGSASIAQAPDSTTITQNSQRAAVDWQSFNVGSRAQVQFVQPSASSIALNRVVSPDPSVIAGRINANGQIVLINQSGVVFANGSQVNAESVVVSTSNVANKDFMAGHLIFSGPPNPGAEIINDGKITARNAGLVGLVAPQVANNGVITATLGQVELAGATAFTLDLYGDRLISLDVTKAVTAVSVGGRLVPALVTNSGIILANGGHITLTAQDADALVTQLIDAGGTIQADSVGSHTGTISIDGVGGNIEIAGNLLARGTAAGTKGGAVEALTTGTVAVASGAVVDASGDAGGGVIAVGTDLTRAETGQSDTTAPKASAVSIAAGAVLKADATGSGNGGTVTLLSSQNTDFGGAISIQGGPDGGNGGLAEISSDGVISLSGTVADLAINGQAGEILLDPATLVVTSNPQSPAAPITGSGNTTLVGDNTNNTQISYIDTLTLDRLSGNVTLEASQLISISADITMAAASELSLVSGGDISITSSISVGGSLEIDATDSLSIGADLTANNINLSGGTGISIGAAVNATDAVNLASEGGITEAGGGISTGTLTGTDSGGDVLLSGTNAITTLGSFSAPTNNFTLENSDALTVNGTVTAKDIAIDDIATATSTVPNAITISSLLDATGTSTIPGTLKLTTPNAGITETSLGTIDAGILIGLADPTDHTYGNASFANTFNSIGELGTFTAGGDFALGDEIPLTVNGTVTAKDIAIDDIATATSTVPDAITISSLLNATGTSTIPGTLKLTTPNAGITETSLGTIDAGILIGLADPTDHTYGNASFANTFNSIGELGTFTAGGDFALGDEIPLTVNGTVTAKDIAIDDIATATSTVPNAITISSLLDATGTSTIPGTLKLTTPNAGITETSLGTIDAGILIGLADPTDHTYGNASFANTFNSIGELGTFTAGGDFALGDEIPLTVNGTVTAKDIAIDDIATATSTVPNAITISSLLDATGTSTIPGTLKLTTPNAGITETSLGTIDAGILIGLADPTDHTYGNASFANTFNSIGELGTFTAGGDFALGDEIPLTVNGTVTAKDIAIDDIATATSTVPNAITISSLLDATGTSTIPGTLKLTTPNAGITETSLGTIDAGILIGLADPTDHTYGNASFANTFNSIGELGTFTAGGDFALGDEIPLTVNGTVTAKDVTLDVSLAASMVPVTAITIDGPITATGITNPEEFNGVVDLIAVNGSILENLSSGVINTDTLSGSVANGSADLLNNNEVTDLFNFTVTGDSHYLDLYDLRRLTVADAYVTDLAGTHLDGELGLTAPAITITGGIGAEIVALYGTDPSIEHSIIEISPNGIIGADTLIGSAAVNADLNSPGNYVYNLDGFTAGDDFLLNDDVGLVVAGPVTAQNIALIDNAPTSSNNITLQGSLTAGSSSKPGTIDLIADGITAHFGTISAPNGRVDIAPYTANYNIDLGGTNVADLDISQTLVSLIDAKVLQIGTAAFKSDGTLYNFVGGTILQENTLNIPTSISTLALNGTAISFASTGDLVLKNPNGLLTFASTGNVLEDTGAIISVPTLTGTAATGNISLIGTGNDIGTITNLSAKAGSITLDDVPTLSIAGLISTGTLAGDELVLEGGGYTEIGSGWIETPTLATTGTNVSGNVTLPSAKNLIGTLGGFTLGGNLLLQDAENLDIAGTVEGIGAGSSIDINDAKALSVSGTVMAPSVTLSAVSSIDLFGAVDAATLLALGSNGSVLQTGGSISAGSLVSLGKIGGNAMLASTSNAINELGAFSVGGELSLTDAGNLDITGTVLAPTELALGSVHGTISQTGGNIVTPLLVSNGVIGGDASLTSTGNNIGTLGAFNLGGSLLLTDAFGLDIAGPVAAGGNLLLADTGNLNIPGQVTGGGNLLVTDNGNVDITGMLNGTGGGSSIDVTDTGALSIPGSVIAPTVSLSAASSIDLSGLIDASLELALGSTKNISQTAGGNITTGKLDSIEAIGGYASLIGKNNAISSIGSLDLNGVFTLHNKGPLAIGTLAASTVTITNTGQLTLTDNGALILAESNGDSTISSASIIQNQNSVFYVYAGQADQNGNGPDANLYLNTTVTSSAGGPIAFAPAPTGQESQNIGLVGPNINLVISAGTGGVVTGNVNLRHLTITSAKSVNLTGFLKTAAGQSISGPAAAANGSVIPTPLPVYKINDCPIGSVNCTILPTALVPVTDPLGNFDLSQRKRKHLYRNVQMPGIATRDY